MVIGAFGIIPGQQGSGDFARSGEKQTPLPASPFGAQNRPSLGMTIKKLFQFPVLAVFASGGGCGDAKLCAISFRRSRRDSPTPSNTRAHASRSFSSAVAAIPEIISRD